MICGFLKKGHQGQILWNSLSECVASTSLISRGLPDLGGVLWLTALQGWIVPEQFLQHLRVQTGLFSHLLDTRGKKNCLTHLRCETEYSKIWHTQVHLQLRILNLNCKGCASWSLQFIKTARSPPLFLRNVWKTSSYFFFSH